MRELKFRAYYKPGMLHKTKGKMCYCTYFENSGEALSVWQSDLLVMGPGSVIIMQYTGLKDKNGEEIYEEDILRGETLSGFQRKRPYNNDVVVWEGVGWKRESYNGSVKVFPDVNVRSMEVIGNIHENPELLEKK